uniref:Uncharacterized protein n=2 Tax=Picea TaxID=3328 RepID=A0A101LZD9_PICGL|nr:hypothetical protein ABT39_MTgene5176 [Picea glauca]QHR91643.1 hypothetical protein Q903MT_gene5678 [Picea sitchensis]
MAHPVSYREQIRNDLISRCTHGIFMGCSTWDIRAFNYRNSISQCKDLCMAVSSINNIYKGKRSLPGFSIRDRRLVSVTCGKRIE